MGKRLPYKANEHIDKAVMCNQMAIIDLVGILEAPGITESEIYRRIGLAINKLHQLSQDLKLIPVELKKDKKDAPAVESQSAKTEN